MPSNIHNHMFIDAAKTLSGFQIRGEVAEIYITYDTLTTKNIPYSENVRSYVFSRFLSNMLFYLANSTHSLVIDDNQ